MMKAKARSPLISMFAITLECGNGFPLSLLLHDAFHQQIEQPEMKAVMNLRTPKRAIVELRFAD